MIELRNTAGQECFRSVTSTFILSADGVILLYFIINRSLFENINRRLSDIKALGQPNIPIILVGNNIDLDDEKVVSIEEGQSLSAKMICIFLS